MWFTYRFLEYVESSSHGSTLLTVVSEAFSCIDHQLLIAKLNAYGVDTNSLYFSASYLEKRKQKIWVNGSYCNCDNIFSGIAQGSILGSLLFNICN